MTRPSSHMSTDIILGNISPFQSCLHQLEEAFEEAFPHKEKLTLPAREQFGFNLLLAHQPKAIIFYSENENALEYFKLLIELISLSNTPEAFISMVFSRSVVNFLREGPLFLPFSILATHRKLFGQIADPLHQSLNEFSQWAFLERAFDEDFLAETLSKLSPKGKIRYKSFLAPYLEGLICFDRKQCQRLLPCWPVKEKIPFSEEGTYDRNDYNELEPNTNTFHYGHGWLRDKKTFKLVKKTLAAATLTFVKKGETKS